jgi:hypothetical protein
VINWSHPAGANVRFVCGDSSPSGTTQFSGELRYEPLDMSEPARIAKSLRRRWYRRLAFQVLSLSNGVLPGNGSRIEGDALSFCSKLARLVCGRALNDNCAAPVET